MSGSRRGLVLGGVTSGGVNMRGSVAQVLLLLRGGVPKLSKRAGHTWAHALFRNAGWLSDPLGQEGFVLGAGATYRVSY